MLIGLILGPNMGSLTCFRDGPVFEILLLELCIKDTYA